MATRPMLAKGWDNLAGLTRLHRLDTECNLFQMWKRIDPRMQWFDSAEFEETSDGQLVPVSLPRVVWTFKLVSLLEHRLLITVLSDSTNRGGKVTANVYDATQDSWREVNGILILPETSLFGQEELRLQSEDYQVEIKELRNVV